MPAALIMILKSTTNTLKHCFGLKSERLYVVPVLLSILLEIEIIPYWVGGDEIVCNIKTIPWLARTSRYNHQPLSPRQILHPVIVLGFSVSTTRMRRGLRYVSPSKGKDVGEFPNYFLPISSLAGVIHYSWFGHTESVLIFGRSIAWSLLVTGWLEAGWAGEGDTMLILIWGKHYFIFHHHSHFSIQMEIESLNSDFL